ncbi:hypothetical protein GLW08_03905 [Pontibacillus yanchengensis]|uniref:Uncharacterized protein n=2 Tax=Pontibacillus yanchengensis TaxID=462910 RepID=A0ACC7VEC3_9BACI|nr:hypothetical protein [Pontibacillus yanchengensis]MYL35153.1 hypothetical protein [Pontibacillus yanchengensis]MYL52480.1 hypothetical protein [Pontibacillus yanchengensis]
MGIIVPILSIVVFISVIVFVKYPEYLKRKGKPRKQKWEGETEERLQKRKEEAERKSELQKSMGRGGGPGTW